MDEAPISTKWLQYRGCSLPASFIRKDSGQIAPPTDTAAVAASLQIPVLLEDGPPTWTMTSYVGDTDAAIWIRHGLSEPVQRFSIAWGVAHILNGPMGQQVVGEKFGGSWLPYALNLVVPGTWFKDVGIATRFNTTRMATVFGVDPEVVKAQAHQLSRAT